MRCLSMRAGLRVAARGATPARPAAGGRTNLRPCRLRASTHMRCRAAQQQDGQQQPADECSPSPNSMKQLEAGAAQQLEQQQQEAGPSGRQQWQLASSLFGGKTSPSLLLGVGAVAGGGLLGSGFDLSGPGSVLQALGVLALTVGIHELGHFLAARLQGIHVTKFAIGFGPTLLKYQGPEVEYSLRAFPLGGFVAFPDDDPDCPFPEDDPNLLRNRSPGERAVVISAGVAANMVLALAVCITQASTVGVAEPQYRPGVKLGTVSTETPAERAGLRQGDILLEVGGMQVAPSPKSVSSVVQRIKENPGRELGLVVEREGQRLTLPIKVAEMPDGTGRIGVALAANAEVLRQKADGPLQAITLGLKEWAALTGNVTSGLKQLFTNFAQTSQQVSGPLSIIAVGAEVAREDISGLLQFCALVNINLAVVNFLPLPALDGGYLVFIILEALRGGQKVDPGVEKGIMASGFLLLMTAGLLLIVKDTLHLLHI